MFENTRPLSVKIPFHINFGEVNLRFYVRHNDNRQWKRGAVFIKEIVPKPAISILANTLYHEKYRTSFSFLHNVNPNSVFMTQGSAISILKKQDI